MTVLHVQATRPCAVTCSESLVMATGSLRARCVNRVILSTPCNRNPVAQACTAVLAQNKNHCHITAMNDDFFYMSKPLDRVLLRAVNLW